MKGYGDLKGYEVIECRHVFENQEKVTCGYGKLPWGRWHETVMKKENYVDLYIVLTTL